MALKHCEIQTDRSGREIVEHGTAMFPVACYHDDLMQNSVSWHWHEELEMVVVTEGCAQVSVGAEKFEVAAGDGFFVNAGVLHAASGTGNANCRFHSLVFHPRLVGGSIDSIFWRNYINPLLENNSVKGLRLAGDVEWMRRAIDAAESAWQGCADEAKGYEFQVRAALSEIIFLLSAHCESAQSRQPSEKTLRDGERIKHMLQFIQANHAGELNVAAIAESASISESECLRCFRSTLGMTPIQYLIQYRVQRAAELLQTTQLKITDIGLQCGFQEMSYFAKVFRRICGCTPGEYRKRKRPLQ